MSQHISNSNRILGLAAGLIAMALAGCGGGDGGSAALPPPPPPVSNPDPVIGANGGTVTETTGASIVIPAGAFDADTTVRIAKDSTGAPVVPTGLTNAGSVYVITPHGGEFKQPVKVRIPAPAVTLLPTQQLKLAKAQPNGEWMVLDDTELSGGILSADVRSFSFFMTVIVTYPLPLAQLAPLRFTTSLSCGAQSCSGVLNTVTWTYTAVGNGGALPVGCENGSVAIFTSPYGGVDFASYPITRTGGTFTEARVRIFFPTWTFGVGMHCTGYTTSFGTSLEKQVSWVQAPDEPYLAIMDVPLQLDVVEGMPASLEAVIGGGAGRYSRAVWTPASFYNRAVIAWQRSDDNGASWRDIAQSYQDEANPLPYGTGREWNPWSVKHGFIATATDQAALLRVHVCYTPPGTTANLVQPCIFSTPTRVNVLQQSALPTIVTAPRSVLVRTGQTASLSVTTAGAPAPTLQWQTRAANSNDAWTNVATGTGAASANYVTAVTSTTDNGTQYRVLLTNSVGSTVSTAVTVSVSDLDVAPSITTQPASLNVASGSDAVFAVDARGTEALSYQWHRNGVAIPSANSPVLRLTAVSILNSGSFTVTVSNDAGDADSSAAILNVYPGTPATVAPTIVTQPASLTVNVGNTATFAVGVDGSGPFTFQWRRNGFNIFGATSAVLTLPSVVSDASGSYSVVVNNNVGPAVTSIAASLSVSSIAGAEAPNIVTQPSTIVVAEGGSAVLAVAASGSGPLTYQWARDGVPMDGETEAVLVFATVQASNAADYTVTVSNSLGSMVSESATVILLGAPVIYTAPSSVSVFENATTTFRVDAVGSNRHYQWLRNGSPIAFSDSDAYTTPSLTVADSGAVYSVIVYNGAGVVVSGPAVLTVTVPVPPTVLQQPADVTIEAGLPANICMAFGGAPPFSVQMNRWVNAAWAPIGSPLSVSDNNLICISTPNLQLADNGAQFIFFASNAEGGPFEAMTRTVTVTVRAPSAVVATTLVSRATSGATANNRSHGPSLSTDGNLVAFVSDGTNLVPGFATTFGHAYVRNLTTGVTTAINQTVAGTESNTGVVEMKMAAGGRYVVFSSLANDLVAEDSNGSLDVFRRDLVTGNTERVNVLPDGSELPASGNAVGDMHLDISADGLNIIFTSFYDMTGTGDALPNHTLFIRNMQSHRTTVVATGIGYNIQYAAISASGEYVAYSLPILGPVRERIWLYDAEADDTYVLFTMDPANGVDYLGQGLSISRDGRYTAFSMRSAPLLGSTVPQVVVIDRNAPTTLTIASIGTDGSGIGIGDGGSSYPKLSDDGRYVLFATTASNLSGGVALAGRQVLVSRDLEAQTTRVASRRPNGTSVQTGSGAYNSHALSGDGLLLALVADEPELTGGATGQQVYVAPRP
jgi:hypothetical protein